MTIEPKRQRAARAAGRAVLVTGCSTGIGRATAVRLAAGGFGTIAGVRRADDAAELERACPARLTTVVLDITDPDAIARARALVDDAAPSGLAGLVNNAGITTVAPLEYLPIDELRHILEVNLIGHLAVTQAMLPALRRGDGRIVNIGSVGGRVALPFLGAYSATKFALEGMSDALRRELAAFDIPVVMLAPGRVSTPIWAKGSVAARELRTRMPPAAEAHYGPLLEAFASAARGGGGTGVSADAVAREIERALTARRPRARKLIGRDARLQGALSLLPARLGDRVLLRALGLDHSP